MKKCSILSLAFCVIFSSLFIGQASAALMVSIGDYTVTEGNSTPVDVLLTGFVDEQIDVFSFRILYDSTALTVSNLSFGPGITSNTAPSIGTNQITFFAAPAFSPPLTADQVIGSFILTGDVASTSAYDLTFGGIGFYFDGQTVTPENGSIQVNAVPIPPTVLLLGAGLVGLVGIRRRVKS